MIKEGTYVSPPGVRQGPMLIVKGDSFFRVDGSRKWVLVTEHSARNINDRNQWMWVPNIKEYIKLL